MAFVLREEWDNPRQSLINKGIGVYTLMSIAADLFLETLGQICDKRYFVANLSEFIANIDWGSQEPLKGFGREGGVNSALALIRQARAKQKLRIVTVGK